MLNNYFWSNVLNSPNVKDTVPSLFSKIFSLLALGMVDMDKRGK